MLCLVTQDIVSIKIVLHVIHFILYIKVVWVDDAINGFKTPEHKREVGLNTLCVGFVILQVAITLVVMT